MPSILRLPLCILEDIALAVAVDDGPGLPRDLIPFLQTCRLVNTQLSFKHNSYLYARLFRIMFDTIAVRRRFGDEVLYSQNLAEQLRTYCTALGRIQARDLQSPIDTLWQAFFMLMEDDGRNSAQLEKAGLRVYAEQYVRERLMDRSEESHGWPAESTANALALFLVWHTTDCGTSRRSPTP